MNSPGAGIRLPRVYPILDTGTLARRGIDALTAAEAFLEGGAQILQFRHKTSWDRNTFSLAQMVAGLCGSIPLIVNDRADFARLLHAGLHVGQDDLAPSLVRPIVGNATLGFSTHNPDQMRAAAAEPIDYVAFGPVFGTASKERPDPTTGVETLREVRTLTTLPLVAIGGVTRENASICWRAGAESVAVIADLLTPAWTKKDMRERMEEWQRI